jgi:hypothetical protein
LNWRIFPEEVANSVVAVKLMWASLVHPLTTTVKFMLNASEFKDKRNEKGAHIFDK